MSKTIKIQDIMTYTNNNGQTEYISYEDPEQKIEKIIYNGKPYWNKTERKTKTPLFSKHVHFENNIQNRKTHKIDRKLTPFSFSKMKKPKQKNKKTKKVKRRERKQRKNEK